MNRVIGGDYEGLKLRKRGNVIYISSGFKNVYIHKNYVEKYEMADKDTASQFSYGKAVVGNIVFGIIGTIAGIGGKNKKTYQIIICFRDGKKSLIEVNEKYYKIITRALFNVENYDSALAAINIKKNFITTTIIVISFIIGVLIASFFPNGKNLRMNIFLFGLIIAYTLPRLLYNRKR